MGLILGFDTSTPTASVALYDLDHDTLLGRGDQPVRTHGKALMTLVDKVFADANVIPKDLSAVVCGLGPGSFTGVRVGLASAKGLCFGLDIPLIGLSSLLAVAARVVPFGSDVSDVTDEPGSGRSAALACLDARRGEVYLGGYWSSEMAEAASSDGRVEPWLGPVAVKPGKVSEVLAAALDRALGPVQGKGGDEGAQEPVRLFVLGTGLALVDEFWHETAEALAGRAEFRLLRDEDAWPDAEMLVRFGARLFAAGRFMDLDRAQPIYLRPSDAEENFGLDLSPKS